MRADDPRHGTVAQPISSRVAGCECRPCVSALLHRRRTYKLQQMGRRSRYPAWRVVAHVNTLVNAGWSAARIAEVAQVPPATLSEIQGRRWNTVRVDHAARILALPEDPSNRYVDPTGTIRRLRALVALGWPMREVCIRAGLSHRYGADVTKQKRVSDASAQAIAALYKELSMQPAPDNPINRHCRAVARNSGWAPPLAYEDIDDLNEVPSLGGVDREMDSVAIDRVLAGDVVPTTRAERVEIIRRWVASGRSVSALERQTGWQVSRYYRRTDAA